MIFLLDEWAHLFHQYHWILVCEPATSHCFIQMFLNRSIGCQVEGVIPVIIHDHIHLLQIEGSACLSLELCQGGLYHSNMPVSLPRRASHRSGTHAKYGQEGNCGCW